MKLINRYLFKNIFAACFLVGLGLIITVWLTQSLKLIDFWMNRGVPFETFLKLILFVLPDLIVIIMPIALLIGLTFVLTRLMNEQELIVLRATGFSDMNLAKPIFLMALGVFVVLYVINLYILPQAFRQFRHLEQHLKSTIRASMVVPGEFNTFKNITIFVRKRSSQGHLQGIFIFDGRDADKPFTLLAKEGQVLESPEGAVVVLKNGTRQEIDALNQQPFIVSFDQYTLRIIHESGQPRLMKPYEMSLYQLLHWGKEETGYDSLKLQAEAHQRLLMPFLCFVFSFIVLLFFLRGDYNRRNRTERVIQIMGTCLTLEIIVLAFLHMGGKHMLGILGAYVTVLSSLIMCLYKLLTPSLMPYTSLPKKSS